MSEQGKQGTATWVKLLLGVSLSLNLLVIGVVGATFWKISEARENWGPRGGDIGLVRMIRALPEEDRRHLREALRPRGEGPRRPEGHGEALLDALRADPFDAGALFAVLSEQANHGHARLSAGQEALVDRIEAMDPTSRAAYADKVEEIMERGRRRSRR